MMILKTAFDSLLKNISQWACFGGFHVVIIKLQTAQLLNVPPHGHKKTSSEDFQCLIIQIEFLTVL